MLIFQNLKIRYLNSKKKKEIQKKYFSSKKYSSSKKTFYKPKSKEIVNLTIDINSADTNQLMKIYGIGSVLSKRIIKYRDLLGGFHNVNQLLDVYAMDTIAFEKFKHQIFVDLSLVKKIDINFASANQLSKYPFINYKLANSIVNYRNNHGLFSNNKELLNLYLMDTITHNKLLPYIDLND